MPSITREQFNKWNAKATNGFQFDVKEYVCWGDKALIRHENLSDGKIGEFRVWYRDEYKTNTNEWGCKWSTPTGNHIPMLEMNILYPSSTEGIYRVISFGNGITLGDVQPKCNYNVLCKLAEGIDVNKYVKEMLCA
jgi:hypothetical protein